MKFKLIKYRLDPLKYYSFLFPFRGFMVYNHKWGYLSLFIGTEKITPTVSFLSA